MRRYQLHRYLIARSSILILPFLPFICQKTPSVEPFVCINKPFVGTYKYNCGFTLLELIVTLAIAGILIALAGPAMRTFVYNQRLTTHANELIADINFARSEAVKRANNAGVCASSTGSSCTGSWQNGWITFVDADNSRTWSTGDSVLRIHQSLPSEIAVTSSASVVVFSASGQLDSSTGAGGYRLCNSEIGKSRTIDITSTGRPSMSSGTC